MSPSNAAQSVRCRALQGKLCFALRWPKLNLSVFAPWQFVLLILVQAFGKNSYLSDNTFFSSVADEAVVPVLRYKISIVCHRLKLKNNK